MPIESTGRHKLLVRSCLSLSLGLSAQRFDLPHLVPAPGLTSTECSRYGDGCPGVCVCVSAELQTCVAADERAKAGQTLDLIQSVTHTHTHTHTHKPVDTKSALR